MRGPEGAPGSTADGTSTLLRDLTAAPNLVSIARIVFIYAGIVLWYRGEFALGLGVGVLAGLSDYLDGWLARRLGQSTRIGGLLDQAADVLFMTGVIFVFVRDGTWPAILLYVVILREIVVLNLRASAHEMGFSLPSRFIGKWASNWMFYSLAVMAAVRGRLFPASINDYVGYAAHFGMTVGVISSLAAAGVYIKSYARQYKPLPSGGARAADAAADRRDEHRDLAGEDDRQRVAQDA